MRSIGSPNKERQDHVQADLVAGLRPELLRKVLGSHVDGNPVFSQPRLLRTRHRFVFFYISQSKQS